MLNLNKAFSPRYASAELTFVVKVDAILFIHEDFVWYKLPKLFSFINCTIKSPIGLNDGPLTTLLIVVVRLEDQLVMPKLILLPTFVQLISHEADEMSKSFGKKIINVLGAGLLDGKFIVNCIEIWSLFFKLEGIAKIDGKVFVWFICKYILPNDF